MINHLITLFMGVVTGLVCNQFLLANETDLLRTDLNTVNHQFLSVKRDVNEYKQLTTNFCSEVTSIKDDNK